MLSASKSLLQLVVLGLAVLLNRLLATHPYDPESPGE